LVGVPGRGISPKQGLYLHTTTQHRKKRTYIHAPMFEWPKTVLDLDRAAFWVVAPLRVQSWRWRQQDPPKHWYPVTTLHAAAIQKIIISVFSAVESSNLALLLRRS